MDGTRHYLYKPPKRPLWARLVLPHGPVIHISCPQVILEKEVQCHRLGLTVPVAKAQQVRLTYHPDKEN